MHPHTEITIVTPSTPRAGYLMPSPSAAGSPVQYRIEERRRTVYVTSDVSPSQWDPESVNQIFQPEPSELEESDTGSQHSMRRTHSLTDRKILIFAEEAKGGSQKCDDCSRRPSSFESRGLKAASRHWVQKTPSPPSTPFKTSPFSDVRPRIFFYHSHDPHYGFTNFSPHAVFYNNKRYPTSEHLFQSFKFQEHRPNLAEHIRTCSERPSVALSEARRFQPEVRSDWKKVNIQKMDETLWHKFTQHQDLKHELLATGEAELIEDSDKDSFWGVGADRLGRNELGKALERLRANLRVS